MYRNTKTETMILGKPSTRNNKRQSAIGIRFPIFVITHARLLAKEVASGAPDINIPVRAANSWRVKKKERKNGTPTNAASPIPRAARRTSKDGNEKAKDCIEAMRPHDATHMETVQTVSPDEKA